MSIEVYSSVSSVTKFRTLAAGSGISIAGSSTAITISATGGGGGLTTLANEGGGAGVFDSVVGTTANLRSLVAGTGGVSVTQNPTTITIANTLTGANPSVTGGAAAVFISKIGALLNFRSIVAGAGISVTQGVPTANDITIAVAGGGLTTLANEGGGAGVFDSVVGTTANLRTLVAGTGGVTVTQNPTTITVENTLTGANPSVTGGAAAVFNSKTGAFLNFRSLVAGAGVTLTQGSPTANDITIAVAGGVLTSLANEGGGAGVFDSVVGTTANLRSLIAGAGGINVTQDPTTITIANSLTAVNLGLGEGTFVSKFGSNLQFKSIAGTANQVLVSSSPTTITLATPQDIATVSVPEFAGLNIGSIVGKLGTSTVNIVGVDNSITNGPNLIFYTDADAYPVMGMYPFSHGNVFIGLDTYFDGFTITSSSNAGGFLVIKGGDLSFHGQTDSAGSPVTTLFRHMLFDTFNKITTIETLGSDMHFIPASPSADQTGTVGTGGVFSNTLTGVGTVFAAGYLGGLIEVYSGGFPRPSAIIRAVNSPTSLTIEPALNIPNGTAYKLRYATVGSPITGLAPGYIGITGATITGLAPLSAVFTDANSNLVSTLTPTLSTLTLSSASNQLIFGPGPTTTLNVPTPALSRIYTVPDFGGPASVVLANTNVTTMTRGFFTPTIGDAGTDFTTAIADGWWTRVGDLVKWSASFVWTGLNGATGAVRVKNLPFSSTALPGYQDTATPGSFTGITFTNTVVSQMSASSNFVNLLDPSNVGGGISLLTAAGNFAAAGTLVISGQYLA